MVERLKLDLVDSDKTLGDYDPRLTPMLAYSICKETGATDERLARIFRVNTRTIRKWKQSSKLFRNAIQRGKDAFDTEEVESAILKRAKGYQYKETKREQIFVKRPIDSSKPNNNNNSNSNPNSSKKYEMVPGVKVTETVKTMPPDVAAATWWLEHRNPERWPGKTLNVNQTTTERKELHIRFSVEQLKQLSVEELSALRKVNERLGKAENGAILSDDTFQGEQSIEERDANARELLDRLGLGGEEFC